MRRAWRCHGQPDEKYQLRIRSIDLFMEEREALLRRCEGKPAVEFAKEYRQFRDNRIGIRRYI